MEVADLSLEIALLATALGFLGDYTAKRANADGELDRGGRGIPMLERKRQKRSGPENIMFR
jgi:hypothetical protein